MQLERIFFCRVNQFQYINETTILENHMSISLIDSDRNGTFEIMIFIGESSIFPWKYEVRIYTQKPTKYKPKKDDHVIFHEQNNDFHTFYFTTFNYAKEFVYNIPRCHSEYRVRPISFLKG